MSDPEQPPGHSPLSDSYSLPALFLYWGGLVLVFLTISPIIDRASFPWDLLVWCESPFMTDMLKLSAGEGLFGPPADVNSFVYAPGLHCLTYAFLGPFGAETNLFACRDFSMAVGCVAAVVAALASLRAAKAFGDDRFRPQPILLALLVVFGSFTFEVPHPDNLQMLHAAVTLWLALAAIDRAKQGRGLALAVLALAWSALGVWAKQPAAITFAGVILAFWAEGIAPPRVLAGLSAAGLAMAALSIAVCLAPEHARFYLFDLLAEHGLQWRKLKYLVRDNVLAAPHRLLLWGGAGLCCVNWARGKYAGAESFLRTWAIVGVFAAGPNLLAYLKTFGEWNNLVLFDLWAAMAVWPALGYSPEAARRAGRLFGGGNIARWGYSVALLAAFAYFPRRPAPGAEETAYCEWIEARLAADLAAGRKALVAHGAMFAIRAGDKSVPLDRANSWLELDAAGREAEGGTPARIAEGYYDVIYLNSDWYGPELEAAMRANYVAAEALPALPRDNKSAVDTRGLFKQVTVLRRQAAAALAPAQ